MARRSILIRLAICLLAAIVMLGVAGAAAFSGSAAPTGPEAAITFGRVGARALHPSTPSSRRVFGAL
jgi:hypothetical protein